MRVVEVHCLIEAPCKQCGEPARQLGVAAVLPDGRIGEAVKEIGPGFTCKACKQKERDAEKQAAKLSRKQNEWARGKPCTTRLK